MSTPNLSKFYRSVKKYVALPSNGKCYDNSIIQLSEGNEAGIKAMTGYDEVMLRNPDALLNGEAVRNLLTSCVVGLKNPDKLLINDVLAMVTAIKIASYGDKHEFSATCPKCGTEHKYDSNLNNMLDTATSLDEEHSIVLSSGLTVFLRPFTLHEHLVAVKKAFEQTKAVKELSALSEEERAIEFGKQLSSISNLNYQLLSSCIVKVIGDNGDFELINNEKNLASFKELLANIETVDAKKIDEEVGKLNEIGINQNVGISCSSCGHEWEARLEMHPTSFFTNS